MWINARYVVNGAFMRKKKDHYNSQFNGTKCPVCGKLFFPAPYHTYKVKGAKVCSWHCVCEAEKKKGSK